MKIYYFPNLIKIFFPFVISITILIGTTYGQLIKRELDFVDLPIVYIPSKDLDSLKGISELSNNLEIAVNQVNVITGNLEEKKEYGFIYLLNTNCESERRHLENLLKVIDQKPIKSKIKTSISKDKFILEYFNLYKDETKSRIIHYSVITNLSVRDRGVYYEKSGVRFVIQINNDDSFINSLVFYWNDINLAKKFADAVYCLKHKKYKEAIEEEEKFKSITERYRALKTKPPMPEEQRKYIKQAENATEEKRYDDAIELYEKAIAIDQTYPRAHFNKALILELLEQFDEAITEMNKYLLLVPDAPDARIAQDKIYVWEGKINK